ncbi:MAG: membrane protein insertase YidC, partial [Planctomycetota bacterium]
SMVDYPALSLPVPLYRLNLAVPDPGRATELDFRLYMGPKSFNVFEEYPDYAQLDAVVDQDLIPLCFCNIPGVQTIAHFLLWFLSVLYGLVGNWGVAIMILTLVVRGSLVPLNFRMQKSMRAYGEKMGKLKPKLDALQKKHANDRKALQKEMVKFQQENKMYPPVGGCLPMFITLPVFIGLFTALRVSYDLRQEPFMLWVNDLSQPDALFDIGLSWMPHFNLLPIIMAALWYWLQAGTPLPKDPQQRQMMKIMRFMPVFMMVVLYNYASGLMVYMVTSSLFGLVEQRIVRNILGPPSAEGSAFTPQTPM